MDAGGFCGQRAEFVLVRSNEEVVGVGVELCGPCRELQDSVVHRPLELYHAIVVARLVFSLSLAASETWAYWAPDPQMRHAFAT